jgi:hypothetical protein
MDKRDDCRGGWHSLKQENRVGRDGKECVHLAVPDMRLLKKFLIGEPGVTGFQLLVVRKGGASNPLTGI